ncbi:hypothetical protein TNIN_470541 [Trichonephila inaurata madagascariensis]|uniref:Uncharacterized protein n=1 Tax=Trichonephila inaurata madagascariensis TaxID=2747483 RepID=A0A8X7BX55_9ARAC|nr:hypothetical protein TNIN_470541 [Trichonephila inaurata madagascariensis]
MSCRASHISTFYRAREGSADTPPVCLFSVRAIPENEKEKTAFEPKLAYTRASRRGRWGLIGCHLRSEVEVTGSAGYLVRLY